MAFYRQSEEGFVQLPSGDGNRPSPLGTLVLSGDHGLDRQPL